jgi:DNA-directed RNA polymerase specialized sigma24 family protein
MTEPTKARVLIHSPFEPFCRLCFTDGDDAFTSPSLAVVCFPVSSRADRPGSRRGNTGASRWAAARGVCRPESSSQQSLALPTTSCVTDRTKWNLVERKKEDAMEPSLSYDDLWQFQAEMKAMAHALLRLEPQAVSLHTTALLVTALKRLRRVDHDWRTVTWPNRAYFFGALRHAMRRALIDHGRARHTRARAAEVFVPPEAFPEVDVQRTMGRDPGLIAVLGEALDRLEQREPKWVALIEYRMYMGLTLKQTATMMDVSVKTIQHWWDAALADLAVEMAQIIQEGK